MEWRYHKVAGCKKIKKLIYLDSMSLLSNKAKAKMEHHVKGCEKCRAAVKEAHELVHNINSNTLFPSEKEINWDSFMDHIYEKIHARMEEGRKGVPFLQAYLSKRYLALLASLAVVITLAILFVFKGFQTEGPLVLSSDPIAQFSGDVERRLRLELAKQATADYLRDGRELLLNLAGNPIPCNGKKIDITTEKQRIGKVLKKKNYISEFLHEPELQRAASLCGEMETILLEASSLESCTSKDNLQEIEETILGRNLLMKIEIITGELGYEEKIKQSI